MDAPVQVTPMPFVERIASNISMTIADIFSEKFFRLIIIVGAYCLFRPYFIKLAGRRQETALEDASAQDVLTANDIRGKLRVPMPEDDEDELDAAVALQQGVPVGTSGAQSNWGAKARKRQRKILKQMVDAEEERLRQLQEDEEDKDIAEFLHE